MYPKKAFLNQELNSKKIKIKKLREENNLNRQ